MWKVLVLALVACTPSMHRTRPSVVVHESSSPDATAISGRVVLAGRPVHEFAIVLTPDVSYPMFFEPARVVRSRNGWFSISLGASGPRDLIIVGRGFARRLILRSTMESLLAKSRARELGDIEVARGNTIRGRIVDENGIPVAGAHVELRASRVPEGHADRMRVLALGHRTAISDATGAYVLSDVAANVRQTGRPELRAFTRDHASFAVELPYGDATLDVELRPTGTVEIVGVAPHQWISISLASDPQIHVDDHHEGDNVVARDVPEGKYIVSIYDDVTVVSQQQITVVAGVTVSLTR